MNWDANYKASLSRKKNYVSCKPHNIYSVFCFKFEKKNNIFFTVEMRFLRTGIIKICEILVTLKFYCFRLLERERNSVTILILEIYLNAIIVKN